MARQRTRQPEAPNGFVSSAVRLPSDNTNRAGKAQGWQNQAWAHYDSVGELRYIANWIGNVMSRATLHAAQRVGNELIPIHDGPAKEAMDALYGGPQNQAQMIQLLGVDLTVGGEGYITARGEDQWDVLATGQITQTRQGGLKGDFGDGDKGVSLGADDLVVRVWTPHPTNPTQADAPTRSNLKTLSQIVGYDDHISAQLTSRLAGAGILFMPSEIQFAAANESDPEATQADTFMQTLGEAMMTPITDRNSPAAFVPVIVTAPGDELEKVQHLKLWSDLDDAVTSMRQSAIMRFAIGMDVPPEVLVGNAGSNHWNAWLSEESAIKAHLEPRLGVINAALTNAYLRPALQGLVPESELADYHVIADTSNIRARPNRSSEAIELKDRGLISNDAVRRETGFRPEDRMTDEEYERWLLERVALGAVTPELTVEALRLLGAGVTAVGPTPQNQPSVTKTDTEIDNTGQRGGPPEPEDSESLQAACNILVFRALELAGNRLKNKHPRTDVTAMPKHNIYMTLTGDEDELLAGAWDCAGEALDPYVAEKNEVIGLLDFYVRGLLSQKRAHNPATLSKLLSASHIEAIAASK